MEATARPAARERGWGCGLPAALSFTALVGTGFKLAFLNSPIVRDDTTVFHRVGRDGFQPRPSERISETDVDATARPAARERGWGCGRPAALSFIALVGTGFKPVPPSVFLRQGAVATIHELLANIGFNPVPPSVFLRQTWRLPQGPQRGSGAGGAGGPQLCLSPRW